MALKLVYVNVVKACRATAEHEHTPKFSDILNIIEDVLFFVLSQVKLVQSNDITYYNSEM